MKTITILLTMILLLFSGCAKLSVDEKNVARAEVDKMAQTTIEKLLKDNPSIQAELDRCVGYAVINWKVTKVPVFGAGGGSGVIVDKRNNERVYIDVSRFDIGGGWGARSYKNLVIAFDEEIVDDAKDGDFKFEAGAEVSAGTAATGGGSGGNEKTTTHVLVDGGGSATATVRYMQSSLSDYN